MNLSNEMIVATSSAGLTRDMHVRKKMHLNLLDSIALTGITTSLFCVKAKMSDFVSSSTCLERLGEDFSYFCKYSCIRCWIGARGFSDGHLIDYDDLIELFKSCNRTHLAMRVSGTMKQIPHRRSKGSVDKRRLA